MPAKKQRKLIYEYLSIFFLIKNRIFLINKTIILIFLKMSNNSNRKKILFFLRKKEKNYKIIFSMGIVKKLDNSIAFFSISFGFNKN